MAFCSKCGAQIPDDAVFCTGCGAEVQANSDATAGEGNQAPPQQDYQQDYQQVPPQQDYQQVPPQQDYQQGYQQQGYQQQYQQGYQQQPVYQNYADPAWDANNNKVYGILAYLCLLVLVTILAAPKESRFSRFHANQGMVLLILEIGGSIIIGIVSGILLGIAAFSHGFFVIFSIIISIVWSVFGIAILVLAIIGIINAVNGQMKPLPIIGKISILK